MATALTGLMTWEEFEKTPDDAMHRELLEGELILLPPARLKHSLIAKRLAKALDSIESAGSGLVLLEAGFKLSDRPPTWIQPDVSVILPGREQEETADGYAHGGPELAVEIVSPSDTAKDLNRKIALLLNAGTFEVWVVYPDDQQVRVFLPGGDAHTAGVGSKIKAPPVFGDVEVSVADLFAGL